MPAAGKRSAGDEMTSNTTIQPAVDTLGIDGCRGGWVWCGLIEGRWQGGLVETLADLSTALEHAALALIDMPIGLLDTGPGERGCDREARALLGRPRASSVFRAPCRDALAASDYATACAINRQQTGVALSIQTWNIVPKIRELDALLDSQPGLQGRLREAHPELCLYGLAGGRPMAYNKRTVAGRRERVALLQRLQPACTALANELTARTPRRQLAPDDAIDAAALAVSASLLTERASQCVPSRPERDRQGLPMEMVYALL
jgi:predicted RNase H-like nuclease